MSTSKLEQTYRCWNDCVPQGCPSHTATLEFQSVSDAFHFNDGKGQDFYGQTPEVEALLTMLNVLASWRVEVSSMIKVAGQTAADLLKDDDVMEIAPSDPKRKANT